MANHKHNAALRIRSQSQSSDELRKQLLLFAELVGKGVYWIIRTRCVGFTSCLLNTVGVCS